jgi:hypothetical protein
MHCSRNIRVFLFMKSNICHFRFTVKSCTEHFVNLSAENNAKGFETYVLVQYIRSIGFGSPFKKRPAEVQ